MTIRYSKHFEKQFKKLAPMLKEKYYERQAIFIDDQRNPILRVHALCGTYQGFYSIDITGDVRALFTKSGTTIVIFGFIGTHAQLY
jgi:mRNA-degrading endonuclease YafQ of YafQ-DinJ toxin-antitoxin module